MVPSAPTSTEFRDGEISRCLDVTGEPCESSAGRNEAPQARAGGDDFHNHPENYNCNFLHYVSETDILLNGIYWNKNVPRLF